MSKYSKKELLEKAEKALLSENFYNQKFVNYIGIAETGERYSEILSEFLLQNRERFDKTITPITRKSSYKISSHNGKTTTGRSAKNSNREEEHIALGMYGKLFNHIGEILDYQVPLKNKKDDKAGKIDLLSFYDNSLHILELKRPYNPETLLRCILEVYTYWKTIDQKKLITDFHYQNVLLKKGILIWETCQAYQDFLKLPVTKKLAQALDVDVYVLDIEVKNKLTTP